MVGRPVHPLLLDLLDDALWHRPDDPLRGKDHGRPALAELEAMVGAAAPDGAGAGNRSLATLLDAGDSASHIFVIHATASALAALGPGFGALVCRWPSFGPSDRRFLGRLTDAGRRRVHPCRLSSIRRAALARYTSHRRRRGAGVVPAGSTAGGPRRPRLRGAGCAGRTPAVRRAGAGPSRPACLPSTVASPPR